MESMENTKLALTDLHEEDVNELYEIMDGLEILERIISRYSDNFKDLKGQINQLEFLADIKDNFFNNIHLYLPLFEVLSAVLSAFSLFIFSYSPLLILIFITSVFLTVLDISYLNKKIFNNISDEGEGLKRIFLSMKKSLKSRRNLSKELEEMRTNLIRIESELKKSQQEFTDLEERKKSMISEIEQIQGLIENIEDNEIDVVAPDIHSLYPSQDTIVELKLFRNNK